MALEIFKLVGSIFVDNTAANDSIAKTDEKAEGLGKKFLAGVGTAGKWAAGITAAAGAVGASMVASAKDTAANMDVIDKASQRMDISAESYQELAHAAGLCGVEMSTMEKAAKKLEGKDLNMDEALAQIYELGTAEERAAKASELFGDAVAYQMTPMLNASAADMEAMRQEANDLGLVMSSDAVKAGADMNDAFSKIQDSIGSLKNGLGNALIPIVQKLADLILKNMPTIQNLLKGITPLIAGAADVLLPMLGDLVESLLPIFIDFMGQLMPVFSKLVEAVLPVVVKLLETLLPPAIQIIDAILPVLIDLLDAIMPILDVLLEVIAELFPVVMTLLQPLIQIIKEVLPPLIQLITQLSGPVLEVAMKIFKQFADLIKGAVNSALESVGPLIENIKGYLNGIIEFVTGVFTGNWEQAWNGIVNIFGNIFEGIINACKVPLNYVIGAINGVFSKLGSLTIPDWVPGIGGTTFSLPQIPLLAKGGDIKGAGSVIVGEAGPELLELPQGARVTPLNAGAGASAGIDYDKLADAVAKAIQSIPIAKIVPNENGIFDLVVEKQREAISSGRQGIMA